MAQGTGSGRPAFREQTGRPDGAVLRTPHHEVLVMAIELKLCEPVHVPVLLRALETWHAGERLPLDGFAASKAFLGLTRNPGLGSAWFVEYRGAPVGYAIVETLPARGFLWQEARLGALYLVPEARAIGIGRAVRRVLRELLMGQGCALLVGDPRSEDRHWEPLAAGYEMLAGAAA